MSLFDFLQPHIISFLLSPKFSSATCSQKSSNYILYLGWESTFHTHIMQQINLCFCIL